MRGNGSEVRLIREYGFFFKMPRKCHDVLETLRSRILIASAKIVKSKVIVRDFLKRLYFESFPSNAMMSFQSLVHRFWSSGKKRTFFFQSDFT